MMRRLVRPASLSLALLVGFAPSASAAPPGAKAPPKTSAPELDVPRACREPQRRFDLPDDIERATEALGFVKVPSGGCLRVNQLLHLNAPTDFQYESGHTPVAIVVAYGATNGVYIVFLRDGNTNAELAETLPPGAEIPRFEVATPGSTVIFSRTVRRSSGPIRLEVATFYGPKDGEPGRRPFGHYHRIAPCLILDRSNAKQPDSWSATPRIDQATGDLVISYSERDVAYFPGARLKRPIPEARLHFDKVSGRFVAPSGLASFDGDGLHDACLAPKPKARPSARRRTAAR